MTIATSSLLTVVTLALGCAGEPAPGLASQAQHVVDAPAWLIDVDGSGTWTEVDDEDGEVAVVYAWVDARVANLRYHKRVFVDVFTNYAGATSMRVLLPASHRDTLVDGYERWGTDAIEIYPRGPHGSERVGAVGFRLRLQHDLDGDGDDEMVTTPWRRLYGDGELVVPDSDAFSALSSPVTTTAGASAPDIYFTPFDDAGAVVTAEIDAIIARHRADPAGRHTVHAAIFNINDPEIVGRLIAAHRAGVEVRLIVDARKFRPWYDWHDGDDRLLAAGVPVLGVKREASGAMHDKIALFDGRAVATGSFNWEWGSRFENHENMLVTHEAELVTAYARRFEALAGGILAERDFAVAPSARVSVSFAPDEEPHRIVGELIDVATESIHVAMFTAKDVTYWEAGRPTSILTKLVAAHHRGVEVIVIVDHGIHEASEYHGVESPDDPTDEWLEAEGIHLVRADNRFGAYASMHHKFLVIDGAIAVTGAFNWYYDAAYRNDEDQLVWRDEAVAARFTGEIVDLLRRYDADFDAGEWPQVSIDIAVRNDRTSWGEQVHLVGDSEATGAWQPAAGLVLDGADWPIWRARLTLPRGARLAFKLVVVAADGRVTWERGDDRLLTAPADASSATVELDFRY